MQTILMNRAVIVGPCGSGKTTLFEGIQGYAVLEFNQEHRFFIKAWKKKNADILIYLDATSETSRARGKKMRPEEHYKQTGRLKHARENCDLYIPTDNLTIDEVLEYTMTFLSSRKE